MTDFHGTWRQTPCPSFSTSEQVACIPPTFGVASFALQRKASGCQWIQNQCHSATRADVGTLAGEFSAAGTATGVCTNHLGHGHHTEQVVCTNHLVHVHHGLQGEGLYISDQEMHAHK